MLSFVFLIENFLTLGAIGAIHYSKRGVYGVVLNQGVTLAAFGALKECVSACTHSMRFRYAEHDQACNGTAKEEGCK